MSFIGDILGDITGTNKQADAATQASQTQAASAQAGIDEYRRQFDALQAALSPYAAMGSSALTGQGDLLGLNGTAAQQSAITALQNSASYQSQLAAGENSILQNASATGGLRGGNTQAALAQFSPALLAQTIQNQYSNLGSLSSLGQNAAAGVGNAGMSTASGISSLLNQQGSALAGGQIAAGNSTANTLGSLLKIGTVVGGFF